MVTSGSFPAALSVLNACAACVLWINYSDLAARARGLQMAAAFSAIEAGTYLRTGCDSFTSVDQYFVNSVYCSLVLATG